MLKKVLSLAVSFALMLSCINFSFNVSAKDVAIGGGAESFNPVMFYQTESNFVGETINTTFTVKVTDKNYKIKINSISAFLPYYTEGTFSNLNVDAEKGTMVDDTASFLVTGTIAEKTNTTVRYTVEYDILDKSGNTLWKNLTGYGYGHVSASEAKTGALGTYHDYPGQLSDGCYFEILETLNTTYVQVSELILLYKIRTQVGWPWNYKDARTRGVNVISGNAPSTLKTMPDNQNTSLQGQMDWPEANGTYRSANGTWLSMTRPPSGYYNFTISFNSWNNDWEDQSNITETTEMYYLSDAVRTAAKDMAEKILGVNSQLSSGYYVQKGKYTAKSWDNLLSALDMAYQVAYSVPDANYGFKIACQNALTVVSDLESAFNKLVQAEHDFSTYKDTVIMMPTCVDTGFQQFTCICGLEKTVSLPATGHTQGDWNLVREATCIEEGYEEIRCTVCDEVIQSRTLDVAAHSYESVVTEPTCTEQGYTTNICTVCGDSYTSNYVDADGHTYELTEIAPTCTEKGYTLFICHVCSDSYIDNYTDIVPHDYEKEVVEPTETEEGYIIYTCIGCGHTYKDDFVPPLLKTVPVWGTVKTFKTNSEDSETTETKIELIRTGEEKASYTLFVAGTGVQEYSFESVSEGNYILRVSKKNHATREYEITVVSDSVNCELVIHLSGDLNGDGRVNTIDTARANAHARGTVSLQGYESVCSDINGDGKINTLDVARINMHVRGMGFLW